MPTSSTMYHYGDKKYKKTMQTRKKTSQKYRKGGKKTSNVRKSKKSDKKSIKMRT